jgi:hypothetical protein
VFVGTVEDEPGGLTAFERLCQLMDRFGVNMAGIDNNPDGRFSQAFAARYPGRVYRCSFFTPSSTAKRISADWVVDDVEAVVSLWRTKTYDAMFERYRMQQVLLPPLELLPWDPVTDRSDFASQLGNLNRRVAEQPGGGARVEYVKMGPEDYAQAEAYNLAAIELYWRNAGRVASQSQAPVTPTDEIPGWLKSDLQSFDPNDYRPGLS